MLRLPDKWEQERDSLVKNESGGGGGNSPLFLSAGGEKPWIEKWDDFLLFGKEEF